ncbi:tetratricopeptide repeat protein [Actinocrispum wychmicini]|uniref:tetratricopeptide repeat protein n=1 Tax=Actinocrispum wychmicini TaxID=1213861 RepID=UPI001FB7B02E|nr:tetratricopeptide repeat protein [Actinocrispum wychmicini]
MTTTRPAPTCQAALVLFRRHNLTGAAAALDSLGYIDQHTGHHDQAVHHYRQALTLCRAHGNTYFAANTLDRLGHAHVALGERVAAEAVWQEALELYRTQGRDHDAERVQVHLATP